MADQTPTVMVSSTCYDLSQVRADISNTLREELGYNPLLSEYSSFPIDPDANTIENCKTRVEDQADILVLVIGGRYGSIEEESGKSITNLEYLCARAKGIPIYVFVDKKVEALLPIWRDNPDADFSSAVDNTSLFEFVQTVRDHDKVWVQGFENAQDITQALRIQFAYLQTRGLKWFQRLRDSDEHRIAASLEGRSLRVFLERPVDWEYRFFSYLVLDGIDDLFHLVKEHELSLSIGESDYVPDIEFGEWGKKRCHEILNVVKLFDTILNKTLAEAFGDEGGPPNPRTILFAARQLVSLYKYCIEWASRIRRTTFETPMDDITEDIARQLDEVRVVVRSVPTKCLEGLESAMMSGDPANFVSHLKFELKFEDNLAAMHEALARVQRK